MLGHYRAIDKCMYMWVLKHPQIVGIYDKVSNTKVANVKLLMRGMHMQDEQYLRPQVLKLYIAIMCCHIHALLYIYIS